MGGVGNGAAEEDWSRDLNPSAAVMRSFLGQCGFGESWDCADLGCNLFATWLRKERFCLSPERGERKGVKGFLLVGHEKVPHGFGLTGDHLSDTADGAGTKGLPEP